MTPQDKKVQWGFYQKSQSMAIIIIIREIFTGELMFYNKFLNSWIEELVRVFQIFDKNRRLKIVVSFLGKIFAQAALIFSKLYELIPRKLVNFQYQGE